MPSTSSTSPYDLFGSTDDSGSIADPSVAMPIKLDDVIHEDATTPFFFGNLLDATTSIQADTVDPGKICSMPTPLMTAASSFSSASACFPDTFGSWSSVATDSRPQTMASSYNELVQDLCPPSRAPSASSFGSWIDDATLGGYNAPALGRVEERFNCGQAAWATQPRDLNHTSSSRDIPMRRFTTGSEPRPPQWFARNASLSNAACTATSSLAPLDTPSNVSQTSFGNLAQMPQNTSLDLNATTSSKQVSAEDGLALWLGQDILTELLDEMKGEHPTPLAECDENAGKALHELSSWDAKFYGCRRNAVAQLPALVSCGLMASMVNANLQDDSDRSSLSTSEQDEDAYSSDVDSASFDAACSPRSCPLSPSTRPLSPKSGLDRARSASMNGGAGLPQMHQILSSWNFTCDRGRYRKTGKSNRKRTRTSRVGHAKSRQATSDVSKALRTAARRRRRPRTGTMSPSAHESGEQDSDVDSDTVSMGESPCATVCEQDSASDHETPEETTRKRPRGQSKSSGNTFSITSRVVLRPRAGYDEEEVVYPNYPATHDEAKCNDGPAPSQGGDDAVDEAQMVFATDLYAPRFTRRGPHGREGWCSLCTHGEWYSMKRSQYLYHLQYDHGVCSLTRKTFEPPVHMRVWNDAMERTEGLCHHCQQWIPICYGAVRKRDYKAWFKHAHKCHRHKA